MRHSYVVSIRGGKITLNRELRDQLNIREDCVLYAKLTGTGTSAIVSGLPPASWKNAFRLIVFVASPPGSLARASAIVSKMGINLLSSWAAATSATGELCWTSLVELPLARESELARIEREICERLRRAGVLTSREPGDDNALKPVRLVPLSVLAALAADCEQNEPHELTIQNWNLDLEQKGLDQGTPTLFNELRTFLQAGGEAQEPISALVTPDTEERYFRIAPLSPRTLLRLVSFPLKCESSSGDFRGYFQSALEVLANKQMNVYSAKNVLVSKRQDAGEAGREVAEFSFMVDVSRTREHSHSLKELQEDISDAMREALQAHAKSIGGTASVAPRSVRVALPHSWPRCFFSTNAKPGMGRLFGMTYQVLKQLQAQGLHPVNVDIAQKRTVYEDVTALLKVCPILVSIHLPEERLRLKTVRSDGEEFSSSDWVVFEEAFMDGLGADRGIIRMRHASVAKPAYTLGLPEVVFTEESFPNDLQRLSELVERHQHEPAWRSALRECEEAAARLHLSGVALERDLESYFERAAPKRRVSRAKAARGRTTTKRNAQVVRQR